MQCLFMYIACKGEYRKWQSATYIYEIKYINMEVLNSLNSLQT